MATPGPGEGDVYFRSPGVATVTWDESTSTVLVEWEGWADSTEFKTLLAAGMRALVDHGGSNWLADCRRQRTLRTSQLATMNLQDREDTMRRMGLNVGYFATVAAARNWLQTG